MKICIYQIDMKLDVNHLVFRDLAFVRKKCSGTVPAEIYAKVYCGDVEAYTLEEVFAIFNIAHPQGYTGRSMTQSDVVEICRENDESKFYFCDTYSFIPIAFDKKMCACIGRDKDEH